MAALDVASQSAAVACVAATAQTVFQIVAPTNQRLRLKWYAITLDGTTNTATPVAVRLLRQTSAGTMSAGTVVLREKGLGETIQSSSQFHATAEPTAGDVLRNHYIPAFNGYLEHFETPGQEITVQGGGRLGWEVNAPANVNCKIEVHWEE
jgi:hypothetical protein